MDSQNFILTGSARSYFWKGEGLCSIKTFNGGPAFYNTGKGNFKVEVDQFLLLNEGTTYAIEIDHRQPVDSFCLFFDRRLVHSMQAERARSVAYLLDHPDPAHGPVDYLERTYPLVSLQSHLSKMKGQLPMFGADPLWMEQSFLQILHALEALNGQSLQERSRLAALKPSTRREIYERLLRAREFLHGNYQNPVSLETLALSAPLSVNHLLRGFRAAFQITPHRYLTHLRLTKARYLLENTDDSVQEIAEAVGFQSVPSFSLLFKKYHGLSPEVFRNRKKGDFR